MSTSSVFLSYPQSHTDSSPADYSKFWSCWASFSKTAMGPSLQEVYWRVVWDVYSRRVKCGADGGGGCCQWLKPIYQSCPWGYRQARATQEHNLAPAELGRDKTLEGLPEMNSAPGSTPTVFNPPGPEVFGGGP